MTDTTTTPARPMIDFSGTSRATAREYAKAANSRVLTAESQTRLANAARGGKVDAYDLNEAILDAMRSASTRLGQSMARRDLTRKIAYLGHITQAVLDNHADALPAYDDSGVRSRKIETLEGTVHALRVAGDHSTEVNQALTRDLTEAREQVTRIVASANEEIDTIKAALETERERTTALIAEKTEAEVDRDVYASAVSYILDRLEPEARERVLGYLDGVKEATA